MIISGFYNGNTVEPCLFEPQFHKFFYILENKKFPLHFLYIQCKKKKLGLMHFFGSSLDNFDFSFHSIKNLLKQQSIPKK